MIGVYFDTYRNLLFGVISSCAGVGTMVLPPLIIASEEYFGWRGCMLILSGIFLHIVVIGAIFRPFSYEKETMVFDIPPSIDHDNNECSCCENDHLTGTDAHQESDANRLEIRSLQMSNAYDIFKKTRSSNTKDLNAMYSSNMDVIARSNSNVDVTARSNSNIKETARSNSNIKETARSNSNMDLTATSTSTMDVTARSYDNVGVTSTSNCDMKIVKTRSGIELKTDKLHQQTQDHSSWHFIRNREFVLVCVSAFFVNVPCLLTYVHYPAYFVQQGASRSDVATQLTILGVCNILSRFIGGVATNNKDIDALLVYISSCGIAGIILVFCPLLSASYGGQVAFSALFGFYSNWSVSLLAPVVVRCVGVENFTMAYGVSNVFAGIGGLAGPPFAGIIKCRYFIHYWS